MKLRRRTGGRAANALVALLCGALLVPTAAPAMIPATTRLTVPAPRSRAPARTADFGLRFLQDARSVPAGGNVTYAVRVRPSGGFSRRVTFRLPNMIDGVGARFIAGATAHEWTLQLSVPATVPPQSGVFVLQASSGTIVHTAEFRLTVLAAPGVTATTDALTTTSAPTGTTPTTTVATGATAAAADGTGGVAAAADVEPPKPAYVDNPQGARQTAAAYAYTWALGTNPAFALFVGGRITVPSDNPDAKGRAIDGSNQLELDCTNFLSQALFVSGFSHLPAWRYDETRHVATAAWVRAAGSGGMPATFIKAGRMRLVNPTGTALGEPPPPGIQIGDIVVWDLNARRPMHIDHQLMVTEVAGAGTDWADIRVSYHTYDHRNRAMDEYQAFVAPDAPKARLYVLHVAYPS